MVGRYNFRFVLGSAGLRSFSFFLISSAFFFFAFMFFVGCGKKAPDWVQKGAGAFDDKTKLYGVGAAGITPDEFLTRRKCDMRARTELARVLNTYIASLMTDFVEHNKDYFNQDAEGLDEFNSYVAKEVSEATLVGSQVIDRYVDDDKKVMYCLAVLDVDNVINNIKEKIRQAVREQHRAIVKERSDEMLKKLDEELEKKRKAEGNM